MADDRFPKRLRLQSSKDFERLFAERKSVSDRWLVLYGAANELGHPRIGLTVSRKLGSAVVRNRWKRLLREAFRLRQHNLPPLDFICIPRAAEPPEFEVLFDSLLALAHRLHNKIERSKRSAATFKPPDSGPDGAISRRNSAEA
jgi:ribonuclease P protein component